MKKLNFLLIIFLCLGITSIQAQQKWTYMVYLFGSDLEGGFRDGQYGNAGTNDLQEMLQAGATSNVNVIVTTGGTDKDGWREIKRWKIENGQQVPIPFNAPNNRMADPRNLTDFINWATATYPADNYVLDLWNHGGDIQGYGGDEIPANNHEAFKIPQLKQAIQNADFISQGKKFEILGFDACLMANLEVHNAMQTFANYIVSSEQLEPGHGWNYTPIIKAMESGSATDGISLGKIIADGFKAQASSQGTQEVTLSVVEASKINNITTALESLFSTLGSDGFADLQKARARSEDYASKNTGDRANENHDVVDIGHLVENLKNTNNAYASAADAVTNALNDAVKYTIKDFAQPNSSGLSLFMPHKMLGYPDGGVAEGIFQKYYDELSFSSNVKNAIKEYTDFAKKGSDNTPPDGEWGDPNGDYSDWDYEDDGGLKTTPIANSRNGGGEKQVARVIVNEPGDIETVRVLLIETNALEDQNDFLTLGAVLPDNIRYSRDGRMLVEYEWDQEWLGINGFPVNIQSVKQNGLAEGRAFSEENDDQSDDRPTIGGSGSTVNQIATRGAENVFTTITVPIVINPDENFFGRDAIVTYAIVEDNYELLSIVPFQANDGQVGIVPKERIQLQPGDRVMLLYDGFNDVENDLFDAVDPEAVFTIENGNEDLTLEPILLPLGSEYRIAFELIDFSQQNTIVYDPRNFVTSEIMLGNIAANGTAADRSVCTGDGESDILTFSLDDCNTENITYVITTDQDIILGPFSGKMEFEGAPVYNFRVYALGYEGDLTVNYGDHIRNSELASLEYALSQNFVSISVTDNCDALQGSIEEERKIQATESAVTAAGRTTVTRLADMLRGKTLKSFTNPTIRTFPNPVTQNIFIDLEDYVGQSATITILNTLGQVAKEVKVETLENRTFTIPVQSLKTGSYMIRIVVDNEFITAKKMIKK